MARKQRQNQSEMSPDNAAGNVDKIREILFGGQMRDYEQRFAELEKRLTKKIETITGNFEKRLERLQTQTKREVGKLSEQVKDERKARREEGSQQARDMKGLAEQVETWAVELEEQIESETELMRGLMKEQVEELNALIDQAHGELSKSFSAEARELADSRVARDDLATILTDVAARLKKNSGSSGA